MIPYFLCDETYPFNLCCNLGPNQSVYAFIPFLASQIRAQTKRLLFIFYTQVPFWFGQIGTQLFLHNSQFQNQMWGVSKPLVQNVHSETEQGHTSHVLPTLASKTNSMSPCLWPSLRYILPPHHFFAPDVTGSDHLH